jgi:hypothetical protein
MSRTNIIDTPRRRMARGGDAALRPRPFHKLIVAGRGCGDLS